MDDLPTYDVIEILLALLPGFLTAAIIGALVLREERSTFDRIIQALIFTFLSHVLWGCIAWLVPTYEGVHFLGLAACAIAWGLLFTYIINTGKLHDFLRRRGITRTASRPNEWYDAFYRTEQHVILHLKDGRRLFGWPLLYPQSADRGHSFLTGAEWLGLQSNAPTSPRVSFLVGVDDIRFVEFVPPRD